MVTHFNGRLELGRVAVFECIDVATRGTIPVRLVAPQRVPHSVHLGWVVNVAHAAAHTHQVSYSD